MFKDGFLKSQRILVTGGGTGLGKAIAVELARAGAAIAVASRSPEHREAGVAAVFGPGTTIAAVAEYLRANARPRD